MSESLLMKLSFLITVIGIAILISLSLKTKPKEYQIDKISKEVINEEIQIRGIIKNIKELENIMLITIEDNNKTIKVIHNKYKEIYLKKGQLIEVRGKLKTYKKDFEIESLEIKIL